MMKQIGFIGIGLMGGRMAANLLRKGFKVTVWNRTASKYEPLVKLGATPSESPARLAQGTNVVISMLRDDQTVSDIVLGEAMPAARPGTTFIDMSTVTPAMCRRLAEAAAARECYFLDAPVLGSREAAADGQLTVLVGGDASVLDQQRDVLLAMGQRIIHVGPNGASAFFKLANNQFVAVLIAALGESLQLIERAKLDRNAALEMLAGAASRVIGMKQNKIAARDWDTQFALDLMFKDLTQTLIAADEVGAAMPILAITREIYQRARQQGKGALDFAVVADPE